MVEIVQDVISTDVAGPLLNGTQGLFETIKALPTGMERLRADGVTVKEVALTRCAPKDAILASYRKVAILLAVQC